MLAERSELETVEPAGLETTTVEPVEQVSSGLASVTVTELTGGIESSDSASLAMEDVAASGESVCSPDTSNSGWHQWEPREQRKDLRA